MMAGQESEKPARVMKLRYAGVCRECAVELPAGTRAIYEAATKSVRCLQCPEEKDPPAPTPTTDAPVDAALPHLLGEAGSSARREHQRRRASREDRIRGKHPKIGGLILALSDEPQSTRAWAVGAKGEERLGRRLDAMAGPLVRVLHDRGIPGSRANIDHIVVCPRGVFIIDAKRYRGRPRLRREVGLFSPRREKLMVGTRDCTRLVDGVLKQVGLVREALADPNIDITGTLCFVDADWPLLEDFFRTRDIIVTRPKKLASQISRQGTLTEPELDGLQRRIAESFPAA